MLHFYWRFARAMTLGVRALVVDGQAASFWSSTAMSAAGICPAAGSRPARRWRQALLRELSEEGNIEVTEPPQLYGMYFNDRDSRRDHVALFVVRGFRQAAAPVPGREIVAHGFFAIDATAQ